MVPDQPQKVEIYILVASILDDPEQEPLLSKFLRLKFVK